MVTRVGHLAPICSKVLGRARWEVAARVPHRSATAPHHHRLSGPTGPVGSRARPGVVGGGVVARNAPPHPQNSDFGDPRTRNARHFAVAYPPQTALARALEGEAALLCDTSRSATAGRGVATWPLAPAKTCAHPRYTSARGPHKGTYFGTFVQVRWRFCNGDCRCGCVDTTDRRAVCPCSRALFPPRTTTSTVSLRLTLPSALRRREARSAITTARSLAQPVQTSSRFEPFVPGDRDSGLMAVSPMAILSGTDRPGPVPLPWPSCGSW